MLTIADLQAMPAETLDVTYESGGTLEDHTFTGTPLLGVIEPVGLDVPEDARNPWLQDVFPVPAARSASLVSTGMEDEVLVYDQQAHKNRPHGAEVDERAPEDMSGGLVVRNDHMF